MPFIPQQPQSGLDTEGLRKHGEEQFREVARAWTEVDKAIVDAGAALTSGLALKVAKAGDTMTGTLNIGPFAGTKIRLNDGTYGTQLYNDGANFYFLTTNAGDPLGAFNGLRPFYFDQSTGNVAMSHAVGIGGALTTSSQIVMTGGFDAPVGINATLNYGGPGNCQIHSMGGGSDAWITFHRVGSFAVNFGLGNDNNMRYGGWSEGGNYYLVWTQKHTGWPVSNGRYIYAGDGSGTTAMTDTIANSVHTGFQYNSGFFIVAFRCRYLQSYTNDWFTLTFAS